jgi:hypothetical protein
VKLSGRLSACTQTCPQIAGSWPVNSSESVHSAQATDAPTGVQQHDYVHVGIMYGSVMLLLQ